MLRAIAPCVITVTNTQTQYVTLEGMGRLFSTVNPKTVRTTEEHCEVSPFLVRHLVHWQPRIQQWTWLKIQALIHKYGFHRSSVFIYKGMVQHGLSITGCQIRWTWKVKNVHTWNHVMFAKTQKALLVTINSEVTVDQRDPSGEIHSSDNKWTIGQGNGPDDEGLKCNPVLSTY